MRVHACIGGARGGGWAETNRKQAFFIRASILNACLTYEAWFGATLARTLRAFFLSLFFSFPFLFFFTVVAFYGTYYRHTNLPRIRVPRRRAPGIHPGVAQKVSSKFLLFLIFKISIKSLSSSSLSFPFLVKIYSFFIYIVRTGRRQIFKLLNRIP